MKNVRFIIAFIGVMCAASLSAQSVTPMQLKEARMAAYQWVRDYNVYVKMEGRRNPAQKFVNLFESGEVEIVNDYLPLLTSRGKRITVQDYARVLSNREAMYKMSFDLTDARITSERMADEHTIEFVVEFDKTVEFKEAKNHSDTHYAYPPKSYHARVVLHYLLRDEKALAVSLDTDSEFGEILIIHDEKAENVNTYTSRQALDNYCNAQRTPIVKCGYAPTKFDEQIVHCYLDTIRNNVYFGIDGGGSFYGGKMQDASLTDLSKRGGMAYGVNVGYYRQFKLDKGSRWGIECGLQFVAKNYGIAGQCHDSYADVDPDGGNYQRLVALADYSERISRYQVGIPIVFRYDRFIRKDLSVYARFGVSMTADIAQTAHATAEASYAGYYDWLFGVTLTQNSIYDFGTFDFSHSGKETSISRISAHILAGCGVQYYIPDSPWAFQGGILFSTSFLNGAGKQDVGAHISRNANDWTSATHMLQSFLDQCLTVQIQCNYNF